MKKNFFNFYIACIKQMIIHISTFFNCRKCLKNCADRYIEQVCEADTPECKF